MSEYTVQFLTLLANKILTFTLKSRFIHLQVTANSLCRVSKPDGFSICGCKGCGFCPGFSQGYCLPLSGFI